MKSRMLFQKLLSCLVVCSLAFGLAGTSGDAAAAGAVATPAKHNMTNWPLEDLRVRQAIAYCTDKAGLVQAGYPLLTREQAEDMVMNSMIPTNSPFYAGDANITIYEYNLDTGRGLLDAAGWTLEDGADFRTNDKGEMLSLQMTTTNAPFRQAWAAAWEGQLADCGIHLLRFHAPSGWWFGKTTGLARRDFEIGAFAWVGQADPGGYGLWACDQIPTAANGWEGQNFMGWCNPDADAAIKQAVNSLDETERKAAYTVLQQEYTQDVPAIPLFNRTQTFSTDANLTGFDPRPGEEYYVYNTQDWEIPATTTIVIGAVQEPASLYTLLESSYVANLALYPVNPRLYRSLDYTYTPQLTIQNSTFDNGLAANTSVLVEVGDTALNTDGEPTLMAIGTLVYDENGDKVAMDADGVMMKQIVATYTLRNDLAWSDGVPLTTADLELGYEAACDPDSGALSYYTCDRTQEVLFATATNTYTVAYLPGHQDPFYYLAPYGFYPAHQVITSGGPYNGQTLAQVPPADWNSLPEVTDTPLGVGPYKIVEWVKGDHIAYAPNPYWPAALGTPKTSSLILEFIPPEEAENLLINGQVDVLGWDTLAGLSEGLVNAEGEGKVKNYITAGATWEHADFNLEYVRKSYKPAVDLRVRQAISYCTDKKALAESVYPLLSSEQLDALVMNTFVPKDSPFYPGDENLSLYEYDPNAGRALLDAAGWTLNGTYRFNEKGESLALKLTTTNAAFRQTWAEVFEQQMLDCGIQLVRLHAPGWWWFGNSTGLGRRDFDLGAYAWVGQADPGGYALWTCGQIPSAANNWAGQNYPGWCNPTASRAVVQATNTINQGERYVQYRTAQQEFTKDLPTLPLFTRSNHYSANADLSGFAPTPGELYYVYDAQKWEIPGDNTIVLGIAAEPGSLFTLKETNYTANLIHHLIYPLAVSTPNYAYTPVLLSKLPTIENGLAVNNTVLAQIGDTVVDVEGNPVQAIAGTVVVDKDGNPVAMGAGGVQMKRLVVTYPWRNDLYWSDGVKLGIDDFELGYEAACDPDSGAASYYYCERTEQVQFATNGTNTYTATYYPGYQPPEYFVPPYRAYPAHQVITSGGTYNGQALANIPLQDWETLPEVTEKPLGVGAYEIVEWVRGNHMTLTANPHAPADLKPKTPTITIKFIAPQDVETKVLDGAVDLVGWDSLYAISEGLVNGETAGVVKNYVIPSGTWEHVDFNLDPAAQAVEVGVTSPATLTLTNAQNNQTQVEIPVGAATSTVTVELLPLTAPLEEDNAFRFAGTAFTLTAYENDVLVEDYQFDEPVTVVLNYSDSDLAGVVEADLALYYWEEDTFTWEDAADTCSAGDYLKDLDMVNNVLTTNICHLSEFSALAPKKSGTTSTLATLVYPDGQARLTATVAGSGKPTLNGLVEFYDGVKFLGSASLNSSSKAGITVKLPPGSHLLTAHYLGNAGYDQSISLGVEVTTYVMTYLPTIRR